MERSLLWRQPVTPVHLIPQGCASKHYRKPAAADAVVISWHLGKTYELYSTPWFEFLGKSGLIQKIESLSFQPMPSGGFSFVVFDYSVEPSEL